MNALVRESVDIRTLQPAKYNPRRIDDSSLAALEKSITRFGMVQEIVVNRPNMRVIGGHQRLKVLRGQKAKHVPVVFVDLPEHEEKALNVALNSDSLTGEFTDDLQALLAEIQEKDEVLFSELLLDQLLADVEASAAIGDPEDVPDVPEVAKTKPGDMYVLGRHRLLCGDSTHANSLALLLQGEKVDSLVTDPPYGVDYSSKNEMLNSLGGSYAGDRSEKAIKNDAIENYREWFNSWLKIIPFSQKATFYIAMSGLTLHELRLAIDDCGYHWGDYLVWVKNQGILGRKDYNAQHEFILYGWPDTHRFYGDKTRTTVLEYDKPQKAGLHPTMKPIALFKQLIEDGSPSGSVILDLFGGSGTTLIACEQTARQARLIEIDPIYCDVIVERWEIFTGKKATLYGNG